MAIAEVMGRPIFCIKRVGLEAGPLSQWLYGELVELEYPTVCVDTRHMRAALAAQVNKSDRNDARGIAQMMRVGLYRPVHVKDAVEPEAPNAAPQSATAAGQGR